MALGPGLGLGHGMGGAGATRGIRGRGGIDAWDPGTVREVDGANARPGTEEKDLKEEEGGGEGEKKKKNLEEEEEEWSRFLDTQLAEPVSSRSKRGVGIAWGELWDKEADTALLYRIIGEKKEDNEDQISDYFLEAADNVEYGESKPLSETPSTYVEDDYDDGFDKDFDYNGDSAKEKVVKLSFPKPEERSFAGRAWESVPPLVRCTKMRDFEGMKKCVVEGRWTVADVKESMGVAVRMGMRKSVRAVDILLELGRAQPDIGVGPDMIDRKTGQSLVYYAARTGNILVLDLLLRRGCTNALNAFVRHDGERKNDGERGDDGEDEGGSEMLTGTPLMVAAARGHLMCVERLLEVPGIDAKELALESLYKGTLLDAALQSRQRLTAARILLDQRMTLGTIDKLALMQGAEDHDLGNAYVDGKTDYDALVPDNVKPLPPPFWSLLNDDAGGLFKIEPGNQRWPILTSSTAVFDAASKDKESDLRHLKELASSVGWHSNVNTEFIADKKGAEPQTPLTLAISRGNIAAVKILLDDFRDLDPNARPQGGLSPLEEAIKMNRTDLVLLLLRNVLVDADTPTPLDSPGAFFEAWKQWATAHGPLGYRLAVKVSVSNFHCPEQTKVFPDAMRILYEERAPTDATQRIYEVEEIIRGGDIERMGHLSPKDLEFVLRARGLVPVGLNRDELLLALRQKLEVEIVVEVAREGDAVRSESAQEETSGTAGQAAGQESIESEKTEENQGASVAELEFLKARVIDGYGESPIHRAVRLGHVESVALLLDEALSGRVNLGRLNAAGETLLSSCIGSWRVDGDAEAMLRRERIFSMLVQHPGYDVNKPDADGRTALIRAIQVGNFSFFATLLERSRMHISHMVPCGFAGPEVIFAPQKDFTFSVGSVQTFGGTALMHAARLHRTDMVKMLLARGRAEDHLAPQSWHAPPTLFQVLYAECWEVAWLLLEDFGAMGVNQIRHGGIHRWETPLWLVASRVEQCRREGSSARANARQIFHRSLENLTRKVSIARTEEIDEEIIEEIIEESPRELKKMPQKEELTPKEESVELVLSQLEDLFTKIKNLESMAGPTKKDEFQREAELMLKAQVELIQNLATLEEEIELESFYKDRRMADQAKLGKAIRRISRSNKSFATRRQRSGQVVTTRGPLVEAERVTFVKDVALLSDGDSWSAMLESMVRVPGVNLSGYNRRGMTLFTHFASRPGPGSAHVLQSLIRGASHADIPEQDLENHRKELLWALNRGDRVHRWTPLMWAVRSRHWQLVRELISDDRIDLHRTDRKGKTMIDHMVEVSSHSAKEMNTLQAFLDKLPNPRRETLLEMLDKTLKRTPARFSEGDFSRAQGKFEDPVSMGGVPLPEVAPSCEEMVKEARSYITFHYHRRKELDDTDAMHASADAQLGMNPGPFLNEFLKERPTPLWESTRGSLKHVLKLLHQIFRMGQDISAMTSKQIQGGTLESEEMTEVREDVIFPLPATDAESNGPALTRVNWKNPASRVPYARWSESHRAQGEVAQADGSLADANAPAADVLSGVPAAECRHSTVAEAREGEEYQSELDDFALPDKVGQVPTLDNVLHEDTEQYPAFVL